MNEEYFGENKNIEFKREIPKRHEKFLKDIVAFANCTGGRVIVGVEDGGKNVYGIGDANPFRMSDDITNMIANRCFPQIETDIMPQTMDGKTVIVVEVARGKNRPYYIKSLGKEKSAYVRINGTSRAADPMRLQELEMEGRSIHYDTLQEIGMEYDEGAALKLCATMREAALSACATEEEKAAVHNMTIEKLENMGLLLSLEGKPVPTHAFNLMTSNSFRYAKIQCALFKGTGRDVFIDRKEFRGPIHNQIEEAYDFVERHINMGTEINGIIRQDKYELPIRAIREAIINGVVHRSYVEESCIQVSIYDDRVEIFSPGGLYGGLDLRSALAGRSKYRNVAIPEALHYMGIIEAWGAGLGRILNSCKEYGLEKPTIEEFGYGFRVVFYRKATDPATAADRARTVEASWNPGEAREEVRGFAGHRARLLSVGTTKVYIANIEAAYRHLGEGPFRQNDVMRCLSCSKSKAGNLIAEMRRADVVERIKGARQGTYRFV